MKYIFFAWTWTSDLSKSVKNELNRLDLGLDVDCPNLSDWLSGKKLAI